MPRKYQVDGTNYHFPDEFSDEQVHDILLKNGVLKSSQASPQPQPSTSYSPEIQRGITEHEAWARQSHPEWYQQQPEESPQAQPQSPQTSSSTLSRPQAWQMAVQALLPKSGDVGRFAANQLPAIGGTVGSVVPGAGSVVGGALGSLAKTGLQSISPETFGQVPQDPIDFASRLGVESLSQGIPGLLGKLADKFKAGNLLARGLASGPLNRTPAVRSGAAREMTEQIMNKYMKGPESELVGNAAQNVESPASLPNQSLPFGSKPAASNNPIAQQLLQFKNEQPILDLNKLKVDVPPGSQKFGDFTKNAFSDVANVRNLKLAAGPQATSELAYHHVLSSGFKESTGTLDAKAVLDSLGGKKNEIYNEAMGPGLDDFKDFLSELSKQQKAPDPAGRIMGLSRSQLVLFGGFAGGPVGAGAALATKPIMKVTNSMLSKVMANPQTRQLVVQAMRTQPGTPQADLMSKALAGAFRSSLAGATTPEQ